jgi:hypothetical protein
MVCGLCVCAALLFCIKNEVGGSDPTPKSLYIIGLTYLS